VTAPSERPLLRVPAVAKLTGIDKRTLYRAIEDGEIPHRRFRSLILVFPDWVDEFLTPPESVSAA